MEIYRELGYKGVKGTIPTEFGNLTQLQIL